LKHVDPKYDLGTFTCPSCGAIAQQTWEDLYAGDKDASPNQMRFIFFRYVTCQACEEIQIWKQSTDYSQGKYPIVIGTMIYPESAPIGMPPTEDMPAECKALYEEARTIAGRSPRGACALLRSALEHLMPELGQDDGSLNTRIGNLVQAGLPEEVKNGLDAVRVIGNNALHPLEMSEEEVSTATPELFYTVNFIVDELISRPKRIRGLAEAIPKGARDSIARRDADSRD